MDFVTQHIGGLNWWAVVAAVAATMPVGFVWYDRKMGFGKRWSKLVGLSEAQMNSSEGMAKTFGTMIAITLVAAVLLGLLMRGLGIEGLVPSALFGVMVGFALRGGAHFVHNGFAKRPDALTWIDVGHDTVSFAVMAIILGVWQ